MVRVWKGGGGVALLGVSSPPLPSVLVEFEGAFLLGELFAFSFAGEIGHAVVHHIVIEMVSLFSLLFHYLSFFL